MADTERPRSPVSPLKPSDGPPESPTTARELDFDDEHEAGISTPTKTTQTEHVPKPPPKDDLPPVKPPRPISAREQAENTLKDAFPTIDPAVVKAVLAASGGQVEPAFNALLGMSDPDSQREPEAPMMPPRPTQPATSTEQSQLETDEMYARQLAEHYGEIAPPQPPRPSQQRYNENLGGSRQGRPGASPNPDDVPWRSFIDDDLPEIRDNIKKGFFETQSTVNKWITTFKKRLDGEDEESDFASQPPRPAQNYAGQQGYNRRGGDPTRRSADLQRYDADPQVIGDDFSKLEMRDGEAPPRTSSRPLANSTLFKANPSTGRRSSPGIGRKVSFQDGPPEEIKDMYSATSTSTARPTSAQKSSKWQPLSAVPPSPVADNDPFSLGDSEDEKDAKPVVMKDEEDDRLQKATSEAMSASIGTEANAGETKP